MNKLSIINKSFKKIYLHIFDKNIYLVCIFVLAFGLRIMGTYPGYFITHPDEPTITESVKRISLSLNFEPQAYYYGSLLALLYSLPTFLLLDPYLVLSFIFGNYNVLLKYGLFAPKTTDIWNAFINSNHFFEYWVRYETALLSTFTVLVGYLLGKKLFNKNVGLVMAFYIAINYRHVLSSNFALADAPVAFFALLSVYLSSLLLKNLSWKTYYLAGVGLGLVFSVKYFVYTVPTFLLCHLLGSWENSNKLNLKNKMLKAFVNLKLLLTILVSLSLFSLINFYIFLKPEDAIFQIEYNVSKFDLLFSIDKILDLKSVPLYPLFYLYKFAFGEILTIFLLLGTVYSIFRYFKSSLILLSAILPFIFIFLVISGTTETRFYSAIIPLTLFFPAIFTVDLAKYLKILVNKIKINISLPLIISVLSLIIGYQSLSLSLLSSYYFSTPHSSEALQEWVLKEMPENSNYVYFWGTPTPPAKKGINSTWIPVNENNYPAMENLYEMEVDYIAIGTDSGSAINGLHWIDNNYVVNKVIYNENFLWKYIDDSYASLITEEIGSYRIKEFTKPWPSLDPSFFIAKFPKFWNFKKGENVYTYNFERMEDIDQWTLKSDNPLPYFSISRSENSGFGNSPALLITTGNALNCSIPFIKIQSKPIQIEALKFYTLSGWGMRKIVSNKEKNNGFLRLDFYSKSDGLLKSYVSKQLNSTNELQNLNVAGTAPINSEFVQITIQINNCINKKHNFNQKEQFVFDKLELTTVKNGPQIDLSEYPYFNTKLGKMFIWLPHL